MVASRLPLLKEPIIPALIAASAAHGLLLLLVGFGFELPDRPRNTKAVTVAFMPAATPPTVAQHVAAVDQAGLATSATTPQTRLRLETRLSLSRELGPGRDMASYNDTREDDGTTPDGLGANNPLSDTSPLENTRVGAVAARRALDADYLLRWRARVEQVGNALYRGEPPAGNGDVRLLVSVMADGTLARIKMLQSSGNPQLDRAAQDTVVLAAPFPAFAPELAQQTSRLDIVRTWQFRSTPISLPPEQRQ